MPEFFLDAKEIGNRIKKRRKDLGISAEVVAEKCNIKRSTYYRIEKGEGKTMSFGNLNTIIQFLSMDGNMIADIGKEPVEEADELSEILSNLDEREKRLIRRIHQLPPEQQISLEVLLQASSQSVQDDQDHKGKAGK